MVNMALQEVQIRAGVSTASPSLPVAEIVK